MPARDLSAHGHDQGPVVAASDYMRAVQDQIRQYVPNHYTSVGADGYAISDTRPAARRHFLIDGPSIAVQALISLADTGEIDIDEGRRGGEEVQARRSDRGVHRDRWRAAQPDGLLPTGPAGCGAHGPSTPRSSFSPICRVSTTR